MPIAARQKPAFRLSLSALRIAIATLEDARELLEHLEPSGSAEALVLAAREAARSELGELTPDVAEALLELVGLTVHVENAPPLEPEPTRLRSFSAWSSRRGGAR